MDADVAKILAASELLDQDRPEEVLELFPDDPAPDSIVGTSLFLAARGLIFEREGDSAAASRCFQQVLADGVPLEQLLRVTGRFYRRSGQYGPAYRCFSMLDRIVPGAMNEFLTGLPQPQLSRHSPWLVGELLSRPRPELYALSPVKEALVATLGSEPAAVAFAQMAGLDLGWELMRMPIASLKEFAEERRHEYEEIIPGRTVRIPPAPSLDDGVGAGDDVSTRAVISCVLPDCVVSSKSNFLLTDGVALLDYQHDELHKVPIDLSVDPIVFEPQPDAARFLIAANALRGEPMPTALSLVGVNSYNFGHLLIEFLPKLFALLGRREFGSVPILVDEQMPRQHREALELFAEDGQPVVVLRRGDAVKVTELWACSMITNISLAPRAGSDDVVPLLALDGEGFASLIDKIGPNVAAIEPAEHKRIYLTRKESQLRRLLNPREVEAWFAERGFELFDLEELSFTEQLALARGAEVIAGPDGSSMQISFFAGPGTSIGILNNPYLEDHRFYALACEHLGQRLLILTGEVAREDPAYRKFSDYRIDVAALPAFLDALTNGSK
jgi:capsular polysaccharide biosynthesis protein